MKKVVILDIVGDGYEPYDRRFILGEVAGCCHRNPSILRNAGMTTVHARGYLAHNGKWENRTKPVHCVSFEVKELTAAIRDFLHSAIGRWRGEENMLGNWAVELDVLPHDWETTVIYPSEFQ